MSKFVAAAPHPSRLATDHPRYAEILSAHRAALAAGEDGYIEPASGNWVFTSAFHLRRGDCCESGCRHCPYLVDDKSKDPRRP